MKKYLLAGLLVWLPLAVTVWVLASVLGLLDGVFVWLLNGSQALLPEGSHSFIEMLRRIPGLGVLVMLIALFLTGVFATNVVGQWALRQGHRTLNRIPIVKSIYSSVQQVSDTLFSSSGNAFREAVLVQYPREGDRHRQAGRRGGEPSARGLPQHLRADDAQSDLGLFPDGAPRRRDPAGDERRRSAQVRDLDGRGRTAGPHRRSDAAAAAKFDRLSARRALSPNGRVGLRPARPSANPGSRARSP